jgi:small-conductance mechanosensitive channel
VNLALALVGSAGALAALVALAAWLQRRFFWARQVAFLLYVGAGVAALGLFTLLSRDRAPKAQDALVWGLVFLGLAAVFRLLAIYFFDLHIPARKGLRLPPLLPAVTMAVIYTVTAFLSLRLAFPEWNVAPLIATSAVTSLVLGLALQPILGNFFAGLVISVERPFRINDWIRVGDTEGRVVAITWRTTHLRTRENDNLVIPNSKLAEERLLNYFYPHPLHMERIRVGVHYRTPPYRVRRVLADCALGVPGVLDKPEPEVFVAAFDASSIAYELRLWTEDVAQAPRIASDVRGRIWEALQREGMVIPYPIQTLELAPRPRSQALAEPGDGPPPARLYVAEGPERGRSLPLNGRPEDERATVGRSRECSLTLSEPDASKEHFRIERQEGGWMLEDLGSRFGTRVNGRLVSRHPLRPLDRIAVGGTELVFEEGDER